MRTNKELTLQKQDMIKRLLDYWMSWTRIQNMLHCSRRTISNVKKEVELQKQVRDRINERFREFLINDLQFAKKEVKEDKPLTYFKPIEEQKEEPEKIDNFLLFALSASFIWIVSFIITLFL